MGFEHRRQLAEAAAFRVEPVPGRGLQRQQVEPALAHRLLPFTALRQAALATAGGLEGLQPLAVRVRAWPGAGSRGCAGAALPRRRAAAGRACRSKGCAAPARAAPRRRAAPAGPGRAARSRGSAPGRASFSSVSAGAGARCLALARGGWCRWSDWRAKSASSPGVAAQAAMKNEVSHEVLGKVARSAAAQVPRSAQTLARRRRRAGSARSCSRRGR